MDGQRVNQWEARCIEEQPPACATACPLRVDVRAMVEKLKAGDFAAACAIYARSIPLPAVLSRICDHPCESACRRAEAGGAIRIAALERAVVGKAYATIRRAPQPARKPKRVAIVGAGVAGLTAAFDLAMKGRAVTVFEAEDRPLPRLAARYPADLPSSVVDADVAALAALGVRIQCGTRVGAAGGPALSTLIADHDAVLVAIGAVSARDFAGDLELTPDSALAVDPETRLAGNPKVFGAVGRTPYSPIGSASDGRRAALSIDRLLQGASLTASRTDEAGGGSCLYVNVGTHASVPPVAPVEPQRGYSGEEAIAEASRCFPCRCLECVKACEYLKHYGSYPKRYVRDIYNNLSIVLGNRKGNRMIDSCTAVRAVRHVVSQRPEHGRGVSRGAPRHGRKRPHAGLAPRLRAARYGPQPIGGGRLRPLAAGSRKVRRRLFSRLPARRLVALACRARLRRILPNGSRAASA